MKAWKTLKQILPGILFCIILGLIAKVIAPYVKIGSVSTVIILGILVGNSVKIPAILGPGVRFSEKKILETAISLLGLSLNVEVLSSLGVQTVFLILFVILIALISATLIGKLLHLHHPFALLLGIGNGICGASAIAAAAPILNTEEDETGLSVSIINFLGTLGIFVVPFIVRGIFQGTDMKTGVLIGGTLQAVGQVTAAGFALNEQVGQIATIVKMGRILMLGPILLLLTLFYKQQQAAEDPQKPRFPLPVFILAFIFFALLVNAGVLPQPLISIGSRISKEFLLIAMAGIGVKITFSSIIQKGPKALLAGTLIFSIQIILGLIGIFAFIAE